jgi:hypothetical protein
MFEMLLLLVARQQCLSLAADDKIETAEARLRLADADDT